MKGRETPEHAGAARYARIAKRAWGQHAKTCWQCRNSGGELGRMCGDGYQYAIAWQRARQAVTDIEKKETGNKGQEQLW